MKLTFEIIILIYFVFINIVAVAVTVYDKKKAVVHSWRVKESTLLIISAIGGSLGMYITMKTVRHKTKKKRFMIGIPLIFILQVLLICAVMYIKPW